MKRFTETQKWEDPWFRKLKPEMKLLWIWILDKCDNAGVVEPDIDLASFQIGYAYPIDTLLEFKERIINLHNEKWFIPKFISFQYGTLSSDCKAHNPVFSSLDKHNIDATNLQYKGYPKGIHTLKEKDKEKEKEKEKKKASNPKITRVEQNSETMARINSWFGRRPETLWTVAERDALEAIKPTSPEIDGMEMFYTADDSDDSPLYRRSNLITLLNNWPSELDKARGYARKMKGSGQ